MDQARRALAERLLEASRAHDEAQESRLARYRNVEADTAELLGVLVRSKPSPAVLELGTSNGYSTIWLCDAAEAAGGRVTSIEIEAERSAMAQRHLADAGLAAELRVEDAGRTLAASRDGEWDVIFLDAERPAYAGYWPDLVRVLRPRGLLVIDNVLSHADEVREVGELITRDARVTSAVVPIGAGVRIVVKEL